MSHGLTADVDVRRSAFALSVALHAPPGEVVAVLGPNGAGKSTVLAALSGMHDPDRGRIALDDRVWFDSAQRVSVPTHKRGVGLLAQTPLLFPYLSALDNVAFGPRSAGRSRAQAREAAAGWLEQVDASDLAERRPAQLSGGQAQRVALARCLAAEPELLLLDEPLAALDIDAAPTMRGLLHRVLDGQQTPTVLVTHDVLDAVVLADRVVVLHEGEIVEQGPTRTVLTRPKAAFTARIAGLNLLSGHLDGDSVRADDVLVSGRIAEEGRPGEPAGAVFAPTAVAVHRERPHGSPRNAVRVRLDAVEPRGDVVRLRGTVDGPTDGTALAADVTAAATADLRLGVGECVWFVVKATEVAIHPLSGGSSRA